MYVNPMTVDFGELEAGMYEYTREEGDNGYDAYFND